MKRASSLDGDKHLFPVLPSQAQKLQMMRHKEQVVKLEQELSAFKLRSEAAESHSAALEMQCIEIEQGARDKEIDLQSHYESQLKAAEERERSLNEMIHGSKEENNGLIGQVATLTGRNTQLEARVALIGALEARLAHAEEKWHREEALRQQGEQHAQLMRQAHTEERAALEGRLSAAEVHLDART